MLTDKQRQLIDDAPESMRAIIRDALEGTSGRARAIKAHCLCCTNFDRKEVQHCPVVTCALHRFRPYIKHDDERAESEGE